MTFWLSLCNIVIIDLVLSGDNAVVIALAVQHLPDRTRLRAMMVGAAGAVAMRVAFTSVAAFLLRVPLLQGLGGLVLGVIAFKLLNESESDGDAQRAGGGFWASVRTIMIADLVMSLDNILAVGGASKGHLGLLLLGLMLSIPLVLLGSSALANLMRRWPALVYLGAGVLAWTAAEMLIQDTWLLAQPLPWRELAIAGWLPPAAVAGILGSSWMLARRASAPVAVSLEPPTDG